MSTKATIRHGGTWHLYEDVLESEMLELEDAIYLELRDVHFEATAGRDGRRKITIGMTRQLAVELGLIKPDPGAP